MENSPQNSLRIDFHSHTKFSYDSLSPVESLIHAGQKNGLDRLVITDHNSIQGAQLAKRIAPDFVIVGEEIMTDRGELLAAFVSEEVPSGLPVLEAIRRLRSQGAFIGVSHPFDHNRGGFPLPVLEEIAPLVDAIEIFNARCLLPLMNWKALDFSKKHNLPGTAGSDSHVAWEAGDAALRVPFFTSADDLRQVISLGKVEGRLSPFWYHFYSTFASLTRKFS